MIRTKLIRILARHDQGSALITSLFMVLLLVTTVTGLTTLVMSQGMIVDLQKKSSKAMQIADAGLSHGMYTIRSNQTPISAFPLESNYNGGSYTVTIEQPAAPAYANWYRLTSEGRVIGETNRRIQQDIFKMTFWDQGFSGSPVTSLQGNAELNGSFYVRSNFIVDRGGAGVKRGPLYVRGDIQLNNAASFVGENTLDIPLFVNGTYTGIGNYYVNPVLNWVPKISLPPVDMNDLKQRAIANGTYIDGNVVLSGKDIGAQNRSPNFVYSVQRQKKGVFSITEITPDPSDLKSAVMGSPKAAAADIDDNIYIADTVNNRIQIYDPMGQLLFTWGGAQTYDGIALNSPSGIRVDGGNLTRNVYVSDSMNNRILRFQVTKTINEDNGAISYSVNYTGQSWSAGLSNPQKIALDSSGRIYVASMGNNKIVRYDGGSTEEITVVAPGLNPAWRRTFSSPEGIHVVGSGASERIFVADTGNNRIIGFDMNFNYLDETSGPTSVNNPRSVFGSNGFIYIAEGSANQVTRMEYSNTGYADKRTFSTGLNGPQDIVLDSSAIISIVDTGNNKTKFYKEGDNGLYVNGITYITGNLTIDDGLIYSLGAQFGTIVVEGTTTINARSGRKFFRPNPVTDIDPANWRLVNTMGFITESTVSIIGSGLDTYAQPAVVALIYAKTQLRYAGPNTFRGIFATNSLIFEQVPKIFIQKPVNMPPGLPGVEPEIFTGGWKELD